MTDENDPTGEIARLKAEVEALKQAQGQPAPPAQPPAYVAPAPRTGGAARGCLIVLAVIGGLIVMVFGIGVVSGLSGSTSTTSAPAGSGAADEASQAYAVGQPIAVGDLKVRVTDVQIAERIGGYIPTVASEGGQLVIVKYSLKNDGAKPVSAGEAPKLHLVDGAGTKYDEDAGKTGSYELEHSSDTKLWSDINPGITTHGSVIFEISKENFDRSKWAILVGDDGPRVAFPQAS